MSDSTLTYADIIVHAWAAGFDLKQTQSLLKSHGFEVSDQLILDAWKQEDEEFDAHCLAHGVDSHD